ncbi:hypothetical protein F2Q68_00043753 [Brassica cretica]|uniref:Uncharacterized protein n=1 Tax=Brassica cretica TaxID=69181 RepID=A0A8S9LNL7_BRACR|nr:hypothetical protein F2Q68_00043753 [Brassica cretica]
MAGEGKEDVPHDQSAVLLELAASRKSIAGLGVPLPPEQDTLLSPNYQHTEYVSF